MDEPRFAEKAEPEEAFAALSDDTRIGILRALWEADDHAATFSELRRAVEMRDSGRFNYHLDKLVGRFVTKTEDGYELAEAGKRVNGAIEAGAYTVEGTIEPIELEEPCATCGGRRTFRYEDETVRVDCETCPVTSRFGVPPSVFIGYDREAIPRVAGRYLRTIVRHGAAGFCTHCDGRVRATVGSVPEIESLDGELPEDVPEDVVEQVAAFPLLRRDCERCGSAVTNGLALEFLDHPTVVGFYDERGIDARELSVWKFTALTTDRERIVDRDPFRASVTYGADGDALTLVVDDDLEVVEIDP